MKRKEFMVGGMTCASCAKAVENVLKKQKENQLANVNIKLTKSKILIIFEK